MEMGTLNILLIILMVILGVLLMFPIVNAFSKYGVKKFPFRSVFKDFGKKMWMTGGLGVLFFGFYLLIVFLGSSVKDPQKRLNLFFLVYKNPVPFVYLGLLTFACASASIYLARMLIKYLYNKKIKD